MKKRSIVAVALLVAGLGFYQPIANAQSEDETHGGTNRHNQLYEIFWNN